MTAAITRYPLRLRKQFSSKAGGYPVDLRAWRSFADARGLTLIEDAAHAPAVGEVGRWGNASAFSFFTNKNMTTAEGGMVVARDASILDQVRSLRAHGMTSSTVDRDRVTPMTSPR
jgi:dTDP-4-amino-4,6-dideoxygalactose transaminase